MDITVFTRTEIEKMFQLMFDSMAEEMRQSAIVTEKEPAWRLRTGQLRRYLDAAEVWATCPCSSSC